MKSNFTLSKNLCAFLLFSILSITTSFAQTFPPANTSCTSKDLELVAAKLTGGGTCNSCPTPTTITRNLMLGINNTTGSTRTSFAFWGTVEIYSGTTGALISSTTRTGCNGPLPGGTITYLDFGNITYTCGDIIKISDIWEAWTTSNGNETCPLNPNNISPKCGKVPSITVNGGVNGEFANIDSQCGSATGSLDLTPSGGTAPYTYLWTASGGGVIPAGQSTSQDLTGLVPGTYSVAITDANGCVITKSRTVVATTPPAPTFTTANPITATCGTPATSSLSYTNGASGACLISGSVTSTLSSQTPTGACGGAITETWTYTDAYGRTITQSRIITVSPAALPTMTAPANTTVACGGLPVASTIPFTNGLSGGCLINGTSNPSTFSITPGACGGVVTETWTATDSCGRTLAPVSRTITVSPAALPTMTAPGNITVACGGLPTASTLPFSNGLSTGCLISGTSNTSTFSATPGACGGTVTETWTATDSCGRALAPVSRTIIVSPAALPTMTAPADITVTCGGLPAASTLPFTNGLSAGCLVSGTSNLSTFTTTVPGSCSGKVTQTWTATDSCGRVLATVSRIITVDDTTAPTFDALPAPSTVSYSTTPSFQQAVATDTCSSVTLTSNDVATPTNCNGSYSITRTWTAKDICNNTSTASQTINVSAAVFVANNDSGTSINGFLGGTSFTNVLVNDTLDGNPITSSQVTTSFVSSTNAGVTLSGTNVLVAPGTPAGNYTLTYQICGALATCSCATATVTVPVTATVIDAVNDTAAPINGYVGGTAFTNVLANDTLNGAAVIPAQVNTTFVSSTNAGVTLSGTNVLVAPGTPAGSYTLTYQICEVLNPLNCDQATVSVSVTVPVIDAVNDTAAPINGYVGGTAFTNVLANDTLNGAAVIPAQVNTTFVSSTNAGVTLSGTNVLVAPGTPAGSYTLTYQICEILNPLNCDQATVSITVTVPVIDAVNDTAAPINGYVGGTAFTNVLANDTLNGAAVIPAQVNTTFVSSTNAGVTLSGTNVLVAPGTPAGSYTLTYQICEVLNPTNCDQATVSVSVTVPVIDAVNDTAAPINGYVGGTAFTNVLANDTLNGAAVIPAQVNTTFVSSTNAGVTLSGTNVLVAPGMPAGSYTLTYQICEVLNPTNCDQATVSITVTVPVIDAVNDTAAPINGYVGGTAFTNVLANDTLNGAAVIPAQVNTTFVSSTNTGVTLSGTNVLVAPGTPAGSYTLTYQICEVLNPLNCDQATVSVSVTVPVIDAVNDTAAPINGYVGGTAFTNVLANDTLNGAAVIPAQVNTTFVSSTNAGVTLSGTNVLVAPGTPAGSYTLTYQICEVLNPLNCDQATVSISVTVPVIDAVNDTAAPINGYVGGTAFTNVLANDTLNGAAVIPAQVNTTFVSSTNAGVTLSGTNVLVAPGTPAGSYTLTYQICEVLNPLNCDQATVSITVTVPVIDAVNDTAAPINGYVGGTAFTNVLANDTLNGAAVIPAQVNTTFVSSTNAGVTLSGTNVLVAAGTPAGSYTLTYQICEVLNPTNCDQATVSITVTVPVIDAVNDTAAPINGYVGGTAFTNVLANDTLNGAAVIPAQVNTTFVSSTNAGVTLSGTNVLVAPGTPAGSYTLTYQICEVLNPLNCDQAVVSITVTVPVIDAVNDTAAPINGYVGGTAFTNVLANDTLNGAAVIPAQVNTTFVSSTNAGVSLSGTNVLVAPGTPAGSYTLTYQICEVLNPTNCDQAVVSVSVTVPVIDAVNDTAAPINGYVGGTAFTNVLANDTLNGAAVIPAQVNTTFVSSTNAGVTLSGTNVLVAAGTPAGSYTLTYQICEVLNPLNCDQAVVSVSVTVPVIDAVNDTAAPINGYVGGTAFTNVLANDTLNGAAVIPAQVNTTFVSSTNAGVTLSGTNVLVAPGTPAGSYTLTYQICEVLNPTNCDQAVVSVSVTVPVIDAVNDTAAPINGYVGGTAFTNVLANDTLNGAAVIPAQVNTTFVSSTNAGVTLSGTNVLVAPGTPAGSYTLTYQICEVLNPTNCDQAVVSVSVTAASIVAANDTYSVDCASIGTIGNILSNDSLNNANITISQVNLSIVNGSYPNLNIDANGNVSLTSIGHCGNYTFTYQICEKLNPTNCDTATATITINDNTPPTFTTPGNITLNTDANCSVNLNPSSTGNPTNVNDNCDANPTVSFIDSECFGNSTETNVNAGNGNYFYFDVADFNNATAANIAKVALAFETNQGKGRAEFTLVSPSGQAVILVGPYCAGGNCDDTNTSSQELYLPEFYPTGSGYTQWNNNNFITTGIPQNFTPNGSLSSPNTITGVTSYVSGFENLTGPMNGTWFIYSRKQANVNGSINFKSVCLTPGGLCPNNRVVTRTWTVTDACGNSTVGTQTVTIQDITAPTWSTTAGSLNTTVECSDAAALAAAQALAPIATDNCAGTITYIKTSGLFVPSQGCVNAGTYTNTWTATDVCHNISTVFTQVITVQDTIAPIWETANGTLNITVECGDKPALTAAQGLFPVASDLCDADVSNIIKKGGNFIPAIGCENTGTYTNEWTVIDACGNDSVVFTQVITVVDTTAPTIDTAAANATVQCDGQGNTAALQAWLGSNGGAVASDTCSDVRWSNNFTALTDGCGNTGTATVTFTATDGCGNATTTSATFTIEDTTAPTIDTIAANATVECDGNGNPEALTAWLASNGGASASDTCSNVTWSNSFNELNDGCGNTGSASVTFTATDDCGNTSTTTATFTIQDTTAPTMNTAAANATVECDGNGNTAALQAWLNSNGGAAASDVCSNVTWTNNFDALSDGCGNTGSATVTFTATDDCGNATTTSATFTIEDTTAPTIDTVATNTTVECDGNGNPEALTAWLASNGGASASDTCSNVTWSNSFNELNDGCGNTGSASVTFTATDDCGNTSTATATFTIEDTTAPTMNIAAANATVECDGNGNTAALQTWLNSNGGASASDVCSNVTWTNNFDALSDGCGNTGSATVIFTATDDCGNATTTSATFTIEDTTAPTMNIAATNLVVQCDGSGNSQALQQWIANNGGASATDICSNVTWSNDFNALANDCSAAVTVTFTATDDCGNATTTSATFTVQDIIAPTMDIAAANATVECDGQGNTAALQTWLSSNAGASASDTCSGVTWTNNFDALSDGCGNSGSATVIFTATDGCGNATTTSATFTIEDTIAPTIDTVAANATVECDGNGNPEALTAWLASNGGASASDTCSNVTWSNSFNELNDGCGNTGSASVTFTATDDCGNTSTTTATFTIQDTTAPTMNTAAANATVECDGNGNTAALQAWLNSNGGASASDVCSNVTWTNNFDALSDGCGNTGSATVTFTATDDCGNATTTSATFTIEDTTPPTMNIAATDLVVQCDGGGNTQALQQWIANNGGASASDICSNVTWSNDFNAIANDCSAAVTVIFTATDDCGNATTTSATFTIQDTTNPVAPEAPATVTVACAGDVPAMISLTATDNCAGQITVEGVDATTPGNCPNSFSVIRTWTFTDACNNTSSVSQTINVVDDQAPVAPEAPATVTVACAGDVPAMISLTATDNCTGQITVEGVDATSPGNCPNSFSVTRTWTFTDACNNTSSVSQTINVVDDQAPVAPEAPATVTVACAGDVPAMISLTATDNCAGQITVEGVDATSPGNCPNSFSVTRTWTFTDACNNTSSVSQTINVVDDQAPVAPEAPATITVACAGDVPAMISLTATDNCAGQITVEGVDATTPGNCPNSFSVTRTWTFTDACNNTSSVSQTINVVDDQAPVAPEAPATITVACAGDVPAMISLTATDNCAGQITVEGVDATTPGNCPNSFSVTRTWTFTDACNNTSSVSQTINVFDNQAPVAPAAPATVNVACAGDVPAMISLTATDNCAGQITVEGVDATTPGNCPNSFSVIRTWTFTDACNNTSSVSQTINVVDDQAPVAPEAPANITAACVGEVPAMISLTAVDNCSGEITVQGVDATTPGGCPNSFSVIRTWTFTDACNNTSSVSQTINVFDNQAPVAPAAPATVNVACAGDVPAMISLTANDNCAGEITVQGVDTTMPGDCPNSFSITRTWTFTDACNNTSSVSQTINVFDNVAPNFNEATPANTTASCDNVPSAAVMTANDNCGAATVTMAENIVQGNCPSNYQIVRTWTAADACGNTKSVTQTINVNDSAGPVLATTIPANVITTCDAIPPVPVLVFTDNCTANVITPNPVITTSAIVNDVYTITMTWTVTDACGNTTAVTQSVQVTQTTDVTTVPKTSCTNEDLIYTLRDLLPNPNDVPVNAVWTNVDNVGGFTNGTTFNAFHIPAGTYTFSYEITTGLCPRRIEIKMTVDTDCGVLPCQEVLIHNAFTPNGDSLNEWFQIDHIDEECHLPNTVEIYNRWGVLVYETKNYDNNTRRFEGESEGRATISKSAELPTGTYFYIIQWTDTSTGKTVNKDGYLYLTR